MDMHVCMLFKGCDMPLCSLLVCDDHILQNSRWQIYFFERKMGGLVTFHLGLLACGQYVGVLSENRG